MVKCKTCNKEVDPPEIQKIWCLGYKCPKCGATNMIWKRFIIFMIVFAVVMIFMEEMGIIGTRGLRK